MTKTLVKQAIVKLKKEIAELENNSNPQIRLEVIKRKAELGAFEAVLESLQGQHFLLKTYL